MLGAGAGPAGARVVDTGQVRAELVAHAPQGVAADQPAWLGLRIDHKPGWHTYWKNPGDSGLPTSLTWTLPPGFAAGEIRWPTPKPLPLGDLVNYGYEGTLLLAVPLRVPQGFQGDTVPVRLAAEWLVCKDVCIPESGSFALELPVRAATVAQAAWFDAAASALPMSLPALKGHATPSQGRLDVEIDGLPAAWEGRAVTWMAEQPELIDHAGQQQTGWAGARWKASIPLSAHRNAAPAQVVAVLRTEGEATGVRVELPVEGRWPPLPPPPGLSPLAQAGGAAAPAPTPLSTPGGGVTGLAAALGLALLGGLLLNLMPCVFPILSLKVVGFTAQAHDRRALLAGGLAYTAGVVLSFVALAGLLLALRAGGEHLGWGFQLQSPGVVVALAALFTAIGLNLAGVFEFGSVLPGSLVAMRARHPVVDAALSGVLAVAVASPCTAPFMGASLGFAITLPTMQALLVFAALGLGMALPYLAASAWPALARALPRPGAWMATFRAVMAFPMFATAVWLAWVLGLQVGTDGVIALLGALLAMTFALWAWGRPVASPRGRAAGVLAALLVLTVVLPWAWPAWQAPAPAPSAQGASSAAGQTGAAPSEGALSWQPWSEQAVAQALAAGRPVFVDFTAAWCVTCQYNKRTTLTDERVMTAFRQADVQLLRADWTRRDPAITQALQRLGRNGVPVYLLQGPDGRPPQLLGEILSVEEVLQALAALR